MKANMTNRISSSQWSQQIRCSQSSHICMQKFHSAIPRTERQNGFDIEHKEREWGN